MFRILVSLPTGYFQVTGRHPSGWTHVVGNYIGPSDGVRLFIDGEQVASDTTKYERSYSAGNGSIVLGRRFTQTQRNQKYGSGHVDELIFVNQALTLQQIASLAATNQC